MPKVSTQSTLFRVDGDPSTAAGPYVPILLIKQGERQALERIDVETRHGITPWLRVVPPELAREDGSDVPPDEIRRFARATEGHAVYLDVAGAPRRQISSPRLGSAYITSIFETALDAGLSFLPVYPFGRPDLASTIAAYESPASGGAVLVRANALLVFGAGSFARNLDMEVNGLGIDPSRLDVMLDLGYIDAGASDPSSEVRLVRQLADAFAWRSIIVSGSSVPDSFAGEVPDGSVGWVRRHEKAIFDSFPDRIGRLRFGDHGVQHEVAPRPGYAAGMRANIRYTSGDYLYVSRSLRPVREIDRDRLPGEYQAVAARLTQGAPFAGSTCCWGDQFLLSLVDGSRRAKGQHWMRAAATCHHLTIVARERAQPAPASPPPLTTRDRMTLLAPRR